jgi:outer membrane protein assembly factor BamB
MKLWLRAIAPSVLLLGFVLSAHAEDWPRWRGPRADGTWVGPALPDQWPEGGLRRLWRRDIGGGYAGIVVANGRVVTMDRRTEPDEVERVLCFDSASGRTLWEHQYPVAYGKLDYGNGPRAAPTIFDERVYTLGALGQVCCLAAATGELAWSCDMAARFGARLPEWGFAASPVIFEDLVIIHAGGEPDASLVAFDRRSGDVVWASLPDAAGYATPIIAEHRGQPVLICWTPENVHGLDPRTGKVHWSVPYKVTYGVAIATPIFQEDTVFVSGYWEGSKAIRLGREPHEHELAWEENRWLRGLMSQPLYRDRHAYLLDKQHGLVCFELQTGKKVWDDGNQMTPRGRNPHASLVWLDAAAAVGRPNSDRVIILNSDGDLILAHISPAGYRELSRTRLIAPTEKSPIWAHPAYAGSCVYARSDSEIVCFSLEEGSRQSGK